MSRHRAPPPPRRARLNLWLDTRTRKTCIGLAAFSVTTFAVAGLATEYAPEAKASPVVTFTRTPVVVAGPLAPVFPTDLNAPDPTGSPTTAAPEPPVVATGSPLPPRTPVARPTTGRTLSPVTSQTKPAATTTATRTTAPTITAAPTTQPSPTTTAATTSSPTAPITEEPTVTETPTPTEPTETVDLDLLDELLDLDEPPA